MELIKFIFSGFWHFVGSIIIIALMWKGIIETFTSIANFIRSFKRK